MIEGYIHEESNPWVKNWIEEPTCTPPCWEGITPGITSMNEANILLTKIPDGNIHSINYQTKNGVSTSWGIGNYSISGTIWADNPDDKVNKIVVNLKYNRIYLNDTISILGNPDFLHLDNCSQVEFTKYCELSLVYIKMGMYVNFTVYPKTIDNIVHVKINPNTIMRDFIYVPIENLKFVNDKHNKYWNGYGVYEYKQNKRKLPTN